MAGIDMKMALNAEILAQQQSGPNISTRPSVVDLEKKTRTVANTQQTEWNIGSSGGAGGAFQEHWPSHLPRPPSMKKLAVDDDPGSGGKSNIPRVIVFNANTQEGSSMVRVLSEKGLKVVAVVRVATNRNTKKLLKLKGVTVQVADLNNYDAVMAAAKGCQQAFLVTKYWERFESPIEEQMAKVVLNATAEVGIKRLLLATFEDTMELRLRNRKSQLVPTADGRIFPNFDGMNAIDAMGKKVGVQIVHMMTSYFDDKESKKSLILIRAENGKIICQSHIQDMKKSRST